ncbi:MAG: Uma2 family endonuclease [Chloroflexota bacterium]|nr:Uma2 family endonuclease [Chloroflexota bacterium]
MATTQLMTADELASLADEMGHYELLRGELLPVSPTRARHGEIAGVFAAHLGGYMLATLSGRLYVAETGFVLGHNPDIVLAPDVAFVRADRLPADAARRGFLAVAPDLAVEIVSPSDRAGLVVEKVTAYLAAGTRLVCVVRPEQRALTLHRPDQPPLELSENATLDGGEVLPGFQIAVRDLFV